MRYHRSRISSIIGGAIPEDKPPRLIPEQMEKLKTAGAVALVILGAAGVIVLSAVAPNIFWAVDEIFFKKSRRNFTKKEKERQIAKAFYYIKSKGYIRMKPTGKDFMIYLTTFGKKRLKKLDFENLTISKPVSWNSKWWQVAADIPTKKYKKAADAFREKLISMKFFPLQRTLWFYPHDPRKEVEFIIHHYGIERFVTVMEVNRLDRDDERKMKKFFEEGGIIGNKNR